MLASKIAGEKLVKQALGGTVRWQLRRQHLPPITFPGVFRKLALTQVAPLQPETRRYYIEWGRVADSSRVPGFGAPLPGQTKEQVFFPIVLVISVTTVPGVYAVERGWLCRVLWPKLRR